jgi:hypothetical protein
MKNDNDERHLLIATVIVILFNLVLLLYFLNLGNG